MKLITVLVLVSACGKSEKTPESAEIPPVVMAAIQAHGRSDAATPVQAAPDAPEPEPVTVKLSELGLDVKSVLGKSPAQVAKLLGHAERSDVGVVYDSFPTTVVRVEFERGKAARVSVTASEYSNTEANRQAVLAWMGYDELDENSRWRVPSPESTVDVWDHGALERADARQEMGRRLEKFFSDIKYGSAHARGEVEATLLVRPYMGKKCDATALRAFVDLFKLKGSGSIDLAKLGFVKMQCGLDGPSITLK